MRIYQKSLAVRVLTRVEEKKRSERRGGWFGGISGESRDGWAVVSDGGIWPEQGGE
ncbi:hypothetical protein HAX54_037744, partial [Datura stramonium]|nr:hypothetical protein [Datura stramonium]